MSKKSAVVAKYHRIRMTDELRALVLSLPVRGLVEVTRGDHVYMGNGTVRVGAREHPARVLIREDGGCMGLEVEAPTAGLRILCPFDSEEERARAPDEVAEAVRLCAS